MKIEKWGTKRFPTDFSKFSEQLFSNFSVSFCFNSRLILKELWICILHIIRVRSLFCSIRVYINLHFLPVLFENPLFCFSVISVFSVCSSCHLFRRYNIFVIIIYISAECSVICFSFQKYLLFKKKKKNHLFSVTRLDAYFCSTFHVISSNLVNETLLAFTCKKSHLNSLYFFSRYPQRKRSAVCFSMF